MNRTPATPARITFTISSDWTPTGVNIGALPEPLRRYIMYLETNADPAGMVRENVMLRDENLALHKLLEEMANASA